MSKAEKEALLMRAIRTLLPGLQVARYSERWSPKSPAVKAFDILAEASGYEPYPDAEQDARDAHVATEYARSRGMVTVAEMEAAVATAKADALEAEADLIGNGTCCPECDGVADMMRDRARSFRPGSTEGTWRERSTHDVTRRGESTPCFCWADRNHPIGHEQRTRPGDRSES